jgi:hypothetical protein
VEIAHSSASFLQSDSDSDSGSESDSLHSCSVAEQKATAKTGHDNINQQEQQQQFHNQQQHVHENITSVHYQEQQFHNPQQHVHENITSVHQQEYQQRVHKITTNVNENKNMSSNLLKAIQLSQVALKILQGRFHKIKNISDLKSWIHWTWNDNNYTKTKTKTKTKTTSTSSSSPSSLPSSSTSRSSSSSTSNCNTPRSSNIANASPSSYTHRYSLLSLLISFTTLFPTMPTRKTFRSYTSNSHTLHSHPPSSSHPPTKPLQIVPRMGPLFYRSSTCIHFALYFLRLVPEAAQTLGLLYAGILGSFILIFYTVPFIGMYNSLSLSPTLSFSSHPLNPHL